MLQQRRAALSALRNPGSLGEVEIAFGPVGWLQRLEGRGACID